MKVVRFEDLEIWRLGVEVALDIYRITEKGRFMKDNGLRDQIRRASISISSNIAEGFEMNNNNDFIRYLKISKGSAGEVKSQLFISYQLKYISSDEYENVYDKLSNLSPMVGKFISYLTEKKKNSEFKTR